MLRNVLVAAATAGAGVLLYKKCNGAIKTSDPKSKLQQLLDEYKSEMILAPEVLDNIRSQFVDEMTAGLETSGSSSLLMLPTYVTRLPDGTEHGAAYALDLGGTNFRVLYAHLSQEEGLVESDDIHEVAIPAEVYKGSGTQLFDFIASELITFITRQHTERGIQDPGQPLVGFCFSFPTVQAALNHGELMVWTKGFTCSGVVGQDVVRLLSEALERRQYPCQVAALLNDTVGVLAASRYLDSATDVGVIIGTGTNACYVERVGSIPKWKAEGIDPDTLTVVNIEWGGFASMLLPRTHADIQLDTASSHPGEYLFEKMVSGLYLGNIARLILLRLAMETDLFGEVGDVPQALRRADSFSTAALSAIHEDGSADLAVTRQRSADALGLPADSLSTATLQAVRQVCCMVAQRSAQMVAVALLAILCKGGWRDRPRRVVVAVDGGVFEKWASYRTLLVDSFRDLLGKQGNKLAKLVEIKSCHDGSALGAAVLAAAAAGRTTSSSAAVPVPVAGQLQEAIATAAAGTVVQAAAAEQPGSPGPAQDVTEEPASAPAVL